jgi:ABC-2 type transport system permease protein
MTMLARIIKHEWQNSTRDRSLWIVAGLFALLLAYGAYNGAQWASRLRHEAQGLIAEKRSQLDENKAALLAAANGATTTESEDASKASILGQRGYVATLPRAPLAVLSVGQSDIMPNNEDISTWSRQRSQSDKYGFDNPLNLLAGRFDLAFVVVYLLPLLVLALSFNVISAEREAGTLPMLLANPVALGSLMLGKIALRAAVIFGLSIGLALMGVLLSGSDLRGEGVNARLLLWIGVLVTYGLFWFTLAVFVNTLGRNSATNAVALVAVWLVLVVIVPSLVNVAARSLYPTPSRAELLTAVRENIIDVRRDGASLIAQWYADHPETQPPQPSQAKATSNVKQPVDLGAAFILVQLDLDRRTAPIEARFDEQLARQQSLVDRGRFFSPAVVMQEALNDLSGTGIARYRSFRKQADTSRALWRKFITERAFKKVPLTAADYDQLPLFTFQEESVGLVLSRVGMGFIGLILPAFILALVSGMRLRRYPVTG